MVYSPQKYPFSGRMDVQIILFDNNPVTRTTKNNISWRIFASSILRIYGERLSHSLTIVFLVLHKIEKLRVRRLRDENVTSVQHNAFLQI